LERQARPSGLPAPEGEDDRREEEDGGSRNEESDRRDEHAGPDQSRTKERRTSISSSSSEPMNDISTSRESLESRSVCDIREAAVAACERTGLIISDRETRSRVIRPLSSILVRTVIIVVYAGFGADTADCSSATAMGSPRSHSAVRTAFSSSPLFLRFIFRSRSSVCRITEDTRSASRSAYFPPGPRDRHASRAGVMHHTTTTCSIPG